MYIAVCDDQAEDLRLLTNLLRLWQGERPIPLRFKTFPSAAELLDTAQSERFTLYLLDVMMPGTSGMAAAREIRSFDTAADIVFLTSSPGFAYESYGVGALDYLLTIIERNQGHCTFEPEDGIFTLRMALPVCMGDAGEALSRNTVSC